MKKFYLFLFLLAGKQALAQFATCTSCMQPGTNLVANGDFSNGNTGFSTNLTYTTGTSNPGKYALMTNANLFWVGGCSITDHSSGGGTAILCVDGKSSGISIAWAQTISGLQQNKDYIFSFYSKLGSSCIAGGAVPTLRLLINATQTGDTVNVRPGSWRYNSYLWNSGSATSAVIQLVDTVAGASGNDFVLDDFMFALCDASITVDAGTDQTTCAGSDVQLNSSGSGAGSCVWTGPAGLNNYSICNPVFNSNVAGDYDFIVDYTTAGCTVSDTVSIHVDALPPAPTIYQYGDTLFASFSNTWQWYSSAGPIPGETNQYYLPSQDGYYFVTVVDPKGCNASSDSIQFTSCANLISVYAGTDQVLCTGNTIQLNATSNGSGTCLWNGPSGLNSYQICNPVFSASSTGIFTYIVSDTLTGCLATDTLLITVNPSQSQPVITRTGDSLISTTAYSYQWYTAGAAINGEINAFILPASGGYYYVTGYNSFGCSAVSDSVLFTPCNQLTAIQTIPDTSICSGSSLTLASGGIVSGNCSWNGPAGLSSYTICNPQFTLSTPGDYTYIMTDQVNGCSSTDTVNIHVDATPPQPVITQTGDTLFSSIANAYQWYMGAGILNGATGLYLIPSQAGTYTVIVTDPTGCQASSNPFAYSPCGQVLNIQTSTDTSICAGSTVMLHATGNGSGNCSWIGSGLNNYAICNPQFTGTIPGDFTFIVTDTLAGCSASDTVIIHVNALPSKPVITLNYDSLLCTFATTYQWYEAGNALPGETNSYYIPSQPAYYFVEITNASGCSAQSDSFYFSPCMQSLIVNTISDTVVCSGIPVTLITTGNGAGNCVWNGPAGLDNYNTCQPVFISQAPGDYTFYVYDQWNGCMGTDSVTIHIIPSPASPLVTHQQDSLLASITSGTGNFQWYMGSQILYNQTGLFYTPQQSGQYFVVLTDPNGCTAASNSIRITIKNYSDVNAMTGMPENSSPGGIVADYAFGTDFISITNYDKSTEKVTVNIYEISGKKVYFKEIPIQPGTVSRVSPGDLLPGLYTIGIATKHRNYFKKILYIRP